jgi:hypothetical protein
MTCWACCNNSASFLRWGKQAHSLRCSFHSDANHFKHTVAWQTISHGLHLDEASIDESRDGREPLIGSDGFLSLTDEPLPCRQISVKASTL